MEIHSRLQAMLREMATGSGLGLVAAPSFPP